ncbi:DUF1427 family protein [Sphingomonas naphthae]|uniref:DUF1427 family protein n=1 Tax=Sphingomonas naphthae TaxID=1813468 RepID=A0ABY7TN34_9SPHN|nr:DUF1427 family protein [Sphingomonas naphthae]WCT74423.1 DUF1427 family protein [Sphingomonas naphthae]
MKPYFLSLGSGLLVGIIYSFLGVRSPAPPTIALIGLLGILLGEQLVPLAKRLGCRSDAIAYLRTQGAGPVLGTLTGGRRA